MMLVGTLGTETLLLFSSCPGPKARGEGVKTCERHPGGEGECWAAESAAGGLQ